ncbi:hypothetical protein BJ322DRAFT_841834 [Thelephora terrestris]|uniref:Uncharacterized protein n=1 Tax=Thelephora terrestris TaxID=56493 RepID=A0A9P6HCS8_9AGAM|nr:hypothetical protein BJ322DRAFT_841834 [Thelephora terrestris]
MHRQVSFSYPTHTYVPFLLSFALFLFPTLSAVCFVFFFVGFFLFGIRGRNVELRVFFSLPLWIYAYVSTWPLNEEMIAIVLVSTPTKSERSTCGEGTAQQAWRCLATRNHSSPQERGLWLCESFWVRLCGRAGLRRHVLEQPISGGTQADVGRLAKVRSPPPGKGKYHTFSVCCCCAIWWAAATSFWSGSPSHLGADCNCLPHR